MSALLVAGADPNARDGDGDGMTALDIAARRGHSAVVSALLVAD